MKVIVQVVEKVYQEAHIYVPDGLTEDAIKQHITDLYNSGALTVDLNIYRVDFESIIAKVVDTQDFVIVEEVAA